MNYGYCNQLWYYDSNTSLSNAVASDWWQYAAGGGVIMNGNQIDMGGGEIQNIGGLNNYNDILCYNNLNLQNSNINAVNQIQLNIISAYTNTSVLFSNSIDMNSNQISNIQVSTNIGLGTLVLGPGTNAPYFYQFTSMEEKNMFNKGQNLHIERYPYINFSTSIR